MARRVIASGTLGFVPFCGAWLATFLSTQWPKTFPPLSQRGDMIRIQVFSAPLRPREGIAMNCFHQPMAPLPREGLCEPRFSTIGKAIGGTSELSLHTLRFIP